MKICPLCHGVSFLNHPLVSSFSFLKGETITKEGVDELMPLSQKNSCCTCDIISNAAAVNTLLTDVHVLLLLNCELHNMCQ